MLEDYYQKGNLFIAFMRLSGKVTFQKLKKGSPLRTHISLNRDPTQQAMIHSDLIQVTPPDRSS